MGKVSRSAIAFWGDSRSMTHNLQRPLARYLSSFAYRLSGEYPSIIKRRYLFSRPAETYGRSFIDAVPFPRAVIRRRASEKKVLRTGFGGSFTICRRDTDRAALGGQRDRYSSLVFDIGPACRQDAPPFRAVLRIVAVAGNPLCGLLKKLFTEPPNKAGWPL